MEAYSLLALKLLMGILGLILQINLLGKGNLAPTSAMDQVQNYVLGGIIGGVIYSDSVGLLQFFLVLIFVDAVGLEPEIHQKPQPLGQIHH